MKHCSSHHLQKPIRWQSVIVEPRDPEPPTKRSRRTPGIRGVANGPGGWRPNISAPSAYRYDGATVIGKYTVGGDAGPADRAHDAGGPKVGAVDLELLFWGDAWRTATAPSTNDVINAMQQLVDSPYLSALHQYGFTSLHLRGATLVSDPGPGYPKFSADNVRDFVWALIDDDVFPEPDDSGGRIIYLVVAPMGATYDDTSARGAHTKAHDTDLFDGDDAWVGWTNNGDLDFITDVLSHELVEAITNPQPGDDDAWVMNRSINGGDEVGDACNQTADRLDGLLVQAYWSEQDKACVIPWHGFSARLNSGDPTTLDTVTTDSGIATVSAGPCYPPAPYQWWVHRSHQQQTIRASATGFQNPDFAWTVSGKPITGSGSVTFQTNTTHPDVNGRNEKTNVFVTLRYVLGAGGTELQLFNDPADGCYYTDVAVVISDPRGGSTRSKRTLVASVWFDGQALIWEDSYTAAAAACYALLHRAGQRSAAALIKQIDHGDPPPPWVDRLPAWLRGEQRERVRELLHLAHYVQHLDPANEKLVNQLQSLARVYGSPQKRTGHG